MPHIRRTLEAVRSAKPRQIAGRARRLAPVGLLAPRVARAASVRAVPPGIGAPAAAQYGPAPRPEETHRFEAYGRSREWGSERFWSDDADGLLFLFHLHGFTTLAEYVAAGRTAAGDEFWRAAIASWLDECGAPALPPWHPFPTSQRLMAWATAAELLDDRGASSFARQARYLSRAVEHDVGGNHVLKNATALVVAGHALGDDRLCERGLSLLGRELDEQVLPDGGHVERSPSYQREIVHDLDRIAALLGDGPEWLPQVRGRMAAWLSALAGPDGSLPLLNDAWSGPPVDGRSGDALTGMPDSGYWVCRHGEDQLIFDAGPLAPAHLPPHAHADALSVVLWLDGRPLLVDPGSFSYTGPERDVFRGTAAHNTVVVDGRDQCEFWGDFRATRLPTVTADEPERHGDVVVLRGRHDGYRPAIHERTVVWLPGDGVVLVDVLSSPRRHEVASSLTLAPGGDRRVRIEPLDGGARVEPRGYAPWLGRREETEALVHERSGVAAGEPFGWAILRDGATATLGPDGLQVRRHTGEALRLPLPGR